MPLPGHPRWIAFLALLTLGGRLVSADFQSQSWPPQLYQQPVAVATDAQGHRYLLGTVSIQDSLFDFDPRPGSIDALTGIGQQDLVVTRIDADGTYRWSQIIGGTQSDYAGGLAVAGGRVFVVGWTYSTNLGIAAAGISPPMGGTDSFVAALDAQTGAASASFGNGGILRLGGSGYDYAYAVVANPSALYVAGQSGSTDFGIGGPGSGPVHGAGTDAIVVALDPATGARLAAFSTDGVQWVGNGGYTDGRALALRDGVLYLGGSFNGSSLGIGAPGTLASAGSNDAFVAALDATTGAAVTAFSGDGLQRVGGSGAENPYALAVDATTVYLTGDFEGLDLGINGAGTMQTSGGVDIFVAALDRSTGNGKAGFGTGGLQRIGGSHWDFARSMQVQGGILYLAGEFWSNNLGIGGVGTIASAGNDDGLLVALSATTGLGVAGFGSGGIVRFGGAGTDKATGLGTTASALSLVGTSFSSPATMGLPDQGGWSAGNENGLLLTLAPASGAQVQDLRFAQIPPKPLGSPPFTLDLTPAATGNSVTVVSSASGVASVVGTTVTILATGSTRLIATQAAGAGLPAVSVTRTLTVVGDGKSNSWPPLLRSGAVACAVDAAGNRFVVGTFAGSVDFDPREGSSDLATARGVDVYLTRINRDGSYGWTRVIGGSQDETVAGLAISGSTVYVCGGFSGSDLGIGGSGTLASLGSDDLFVAALATSDGSAVTAFHGGLQRIGGDSTEYARAIAVSGSTVYVAGESWSPNIGIGALGSLGTVNATLDGFVAALSMSTGTAVTAFSTDGLQLIGGGSYDRIAAMTVSGTSLVVTGEFMSSNLGIGGTGALAATQVSTYVAELSLTTGAATMAFSGDGLLRITATSRVSPRDVTAAGGKLYVVGQFDSVISIDGNPGSLAPISGNDAFVAVVDATSGAPAAFGTAGLQRIGGNGIDDGRAIVVDGSTAYVLVEGGSSNLGINGIGSWRSVGFTDLFLVALDQANGTAKTTFGRNGIIQVSGTATESGCDLALSGSELLVLGTTNGTSLALSDTPTQWTTTSSWSSLLLTLAGATGLQPQSLQLAAIPGKGVNDPPFTLQVTSDPSGNPVTITCDNPRVATISGTTVTIVGSGSARIYATQAGGNGKVAVTVSRPLMVYGDDSVASWPPNLRGPITAIAEDQAGNRYVTGSFLGGGDFDPRPGAIQVRVAVGQSDAFVTRIDADGSYAWTQVVGGSGADFATALAVSGGVVYVGGEFSGNDLGIGGAGTIASASLSVDGFIAALDAGTGAAKTAFGSNGVQRIGGSLADGICGLAVDGALYFTGYFASTNLGIGAVGAIAPLGSTDAMVGALSPTTGAAISAFAGTGVQRIGGAGTRGNALQVAAGRVLVAGTISGTNIGIGSIGGGTTAGQEDGFVAALDATTGAAITAFSGDGIQVFGGSGTDSATGLAVSGNTIYLVGTFQSQDLGIGGVGTLAVTGINNDLVVVALAFADGAPRTGFGHGGAQRLGGTLSDLSRAIAANATGVYVAGSFQGTDCGIDGRGSLSAVGSTDALVARLDPVTGLGMGAFSSDGLERIGGRSIDSAQGLLLSRDGRLLVVGEMQSTDGGIGADAPGAWNPSYGWNGFLLSLDPASGRRSQQLTMAPLRAVALGSPAFTLDLMPDPSGNPVTVTSSSPYYATVSGTTVTPLHAGTTSIIAYQAAGNGFEATSCGRLLAVVADDATSAWPPMHAGTTRGVAIDAAGNRYVVGEFTQHRDFDPRPGIIDPRANQGFEDVFVTRFNANGSYAWTQVIASTGPDHAVAIAVAGSELVVTGTFDRGDLGIADLGTLATRGGTDVFLARLVAATGAPVTGFGSNGLLRIGSSAEDHVGGLVVLGSTTYVVGDFMGTDLGIGSASTQSTRGFQDVFVAAITPTGAPLPGFSGDGIQILGGDTTDVGRAIVVVDGDLLVGGSFISVDFGIGTASTVHSLFNQDGFVARLSGSTGAAVPGFGINGIQVIAGGADEEVLDLVVQDHVIYATGAFSCHDLGIGAAGSLSCIGSGSAFVAAMDAATGAAINSFAGDGLQLIGCSASAQGRRVVADADEVIVAGDFTGSDLGIGGVGALPGSGYGTVFLARLDRVNGNPHSAFGGDGLERLGGTGGDNLADLLLDHGTLTIAARILSQDAGYGGPGIWNGGNGWDSLLFTLPLSGGLPAGIDVIDTTVVVDGNPHQAPLVVTPNGLRTSVTYNGASAAPSAIGTYAIQAAITQSGYSGTASGTLTIAKARLVVTAEAKERRRGANDPPFTATFQGFVGGDTVAIITAPTVMTTTATAASGVGSYPIAATGTVAPGYLVQHVAGTLRIFDFNVTQVTLRGTVSGGTPTVLVDGTASIQAGDAWEAAGSVGNDASRVFNVDASNGTGATAHETITIEAVDLPLGGG